MSDDRSACGRAGLDSALDLGVTESCDMLTLKNTAPRPTAIRPGRGRIPHPRFGIPCRADVCAIRHRRAEIRMPGVCSANLGRPAGRTRR